MFISIKYILYNNDMYTLLALAAVIGINSLRIN